MLLVDIILPTFNRYNRLRDCVESVINQTYSNWRLLIVDDCSSDDTKTVGRCLCSRDNRIKYIRSDTNRGLPAIRNYGLAQSNGDLVFFIEDDMVLDLECLFSLVNSYKLLNSQGYMVGAVAPTINNIETDGEGQGNNMIKEKRKKLRNPCTIGALTGLVYFNYGSRWEHLIGIPNAHACCLYDSKVYRNVGYYDDKRYRGNYLYEDADFNHRLRQCGYTIFFEPKAKMEHLAVSVGGCRTSSSINYAYYFCRNHTKYVLKNYKLKSLYMIPAFYLYAIYLGFGWLKRWLSS